MEKDYLNRDFLEWAAANHADVYKVTERDWQMQRRYNPKAYSYSYVADGLTVFLFEPGVMSERFDAWVHRDKTKSVRSKRKFYEKQQSFGNRFRDWFSLEELMDDDDFSGLTALRYMGGGHKLTAYGIPKEEIPARLKAALAENPALDLSKVYYSECAPDSHIILQGEAGYIAPVGLTLWVSRAKVGMRYIPQKDWFEVTGLSARMLLEGALLPCSMDDFRAIFEQYPDDMIEFSAFDKKVGRYPRRNHVVWEVRGY